MYSQAHDKGRKLDFQSRQRQPIFRHPYEKYNSHVASDSICKINESNRDFCVNRSSPNPRKRKDAQKSFQDKNIYICQTFLKENPFFGVYDSDARPRSENDEGTSEGGSDRSRSVGTDFDDSKTYKVIHSEDSNGNGDRSCLSRCKFKKTDDIHHFHEHHHFFHDEEGKLGKSKESAGNPLIDPNISLLKQPILESCMFYQKDEGSEARKSREASRGVSRCSSKTERKSSDNGTYTVMCEYCQKLLGEYPNARVVGYENVPVRLSTEVTDRRPYVQYCYNGESKQKNWTVANTFIAETVQGSSMSHESSRPKKSERLPKITDESDTSRGSSFPRVRSPPRERKGPKSANERGTRQRVSPKTTSNPKIILFKCDHCKSIIQFPYRFTVLKSSSSSCSTCSSEEVLRRVTVKRSVVNEKVIPKARCVPSAMVNKSYVSSHRRSLILEESQSSVEDTKKHFSPKSSFAIEKDKMSGQKATRPSIVSATKRISAEKATQAHSTNSGYMDSKEVIQERKKRSSNHNESVLMDKKPQSVKERRASSEMSKGVLTTKGSIEVSLVNKDSPKKKSSSAYKVPKETSDMMTKKSSRCCESKLLPCKSEESNDSDPVKEMRKKSFKESTKSMNKKISTSRKELGVSSKRAVGTEVYMAKVEGKQKVILMKEKSMQTSTGKLATGDETKTQKRSRTASRSVNVKTETERSGTAPGSLVNSRSTNTHQESSGVRGSSTLSKRTIASKEVPTMTIDPVREPDSGLIGIQSEISDLKSQLHRLEAMHNLNREAPESEIIGNHEAADCLKHPIVVCTSTTFIMTNYGVENDGKYPKETPKPKESIKIPSKKKDSAAEFGLHVESTPPRRRRVYVGQVRETPEDTEPSKTKYYNHGNSLGKATTPNCYAIGDRITKAGNRICQRSNRDMLSRQGEGYKLLHKGDGYHRLFGNGKNQKRIWTGNGAWIDDCCMKFAVDMESHCRWHSIEFDKSEVLKAIASMAQNKGLLSFRSCSAIFGGRKLSITCDEISSEILKGTPENGITIENVRIEGKKGSGYFLKTSVSDICEYRNGSLIRLTGRSGWVVLTKKLFLQKVQKTKERDDFFVYPAMTPKNAKLRPAITIKPREDNSMKREGSEDILADYDLGRDNPRHVLSDSSIYLPLTLKDYSEGRKKVFKDNDVSRSWHTAKNLRYRNRGTLNVRELTNKRNTGYFSDELYLMNCKNADDRNATCGVGSEGDAQCTCKQEYTGRWSQRDGQNSWKQQKETVPVLFEEMKPAEEAEAQKQFSDVSLKCVYAEAFRDKRTGNKVFWSSDRCDSRNKNKYVFAVSRAGRSSSNREFSMNEKLRRRKWLRHTMNRSAVSNRSGGSSRHVLNSRSEVSTRSLANSGSGEGNSQSRVNTKSDVRTRSGVPIRNGVNSRSGVYTRSEDIDRISSVNEDLTRNSPSREAKPPGDYSQSPPKRCGCCYCSQQHVCSGPNEKREEISGFRRFMKDVGLGGLNLNFFKRVNCDNDFRRGPDRSANSFKVQEVRKKVEVDDFRKEVRHSSSNLRGYEPKCDCAKQIEEMLNKLDVCRPPPPRPSPPVIKSEVWEEEYEKEEVQSAPPSRSAAKIYKQSETNFEVNTTRTPELVTTGAVNANILEDIQEQRLRIEECENMLRKFEMELKDVRQRNEAFSKKCNEILKQKPFVQKGAVSDIVSNKSDFEVTSKEIIEEEDVASQLKQVKVITDQSCCSLPSKIEILSERKVCTCQECSNIHYIDKCYLPTSWIKKCMCHTPGVKPSTDVPFKAKELSGEKKPVEDAEELISKSDLDSSYENGLNDKSGKLAQPQCGDISAISCECATKCDKAKGSQCCKCDSKIRSIENRLRALESGKKMSELGSEKSRTTTDLEEDSEERESDNEEEIIETEETVSKKKKKARKKESGTDLSSLDNIESETDNEYITRLITCNNLQFFVGDDPNMNTKCRCTEDSPCALRFINDDNLRQTKNIFFVTNIELLRQWSGLFCPDYKYCNSFWNVKKAALKPVKVHRDWRSVRSAVTSFFRRKKYNIFKRSKKNEEPPYSTTASSVSVESFLNDCSRSSMPLKKRSFHVLSEGPRPVRPGRVQGKTSSKRNRKTNPVKTA